MVYFRLLPQDFTLPLGNTQGLMEGPGLSEEQANLCLVRLICVTKVCLAVDFSER